jgi:hypothetical protein
MTAFLAASGPWSLLVQDGRIDPHDRPDAPVELERPARHGDDRSPS